MIVLKGLAASTLQRPAGFKAVGDAHPTTTCWLQSGGRCPPYNDNDLLTSKRWAVPTLQRQRPAGFKAVGDAHPTTTTDS